MSGIWQGRGIPLAWLLLTRQPQRLAIAVAGIVFASTLIFMQLGFQDALFESSVTIHKRLDTDLVLASPKSMSSSGMVGFPRRRLVQTMADPAVAGTTPVHWKMILWLNPENRTTTRSIYALGIDPSDSLFQNTNIIKQSQLLSQIGRVIFDEKSRPEFGPIAQLFRQGRTVETELAGKRVRVVGLVSLGPSFGADGNMIISSETFEWLMPDTPKGSIELGLVRLVPGSDPLEVAERLRQFLPRDVVVYTKQGFEEFEKNYWSSGTAIGFIFTLGSSMGFVVGCVIVYQILHSDVSDHLSEYATLMAMGYRLVDLLGVVAREALLLALLGFPPAFFAGIGLYGLVRSATGLPASMDSHRALLVFGLILAMCMGSGILAMRRLGDADPAEIF
jgi:putative ABC transport system permease protein